MRAVTLCQMIFSVTGFDDITFATLALTTMKQPRLNIGEAAMDLLLALLEGKENKQPQVLLRFELIVKNSIKIYARET